MTDHVPPSPAPDGPDALIDVLERQTRILDELGGLAERQATLIAERHTDALLELLARRQSLIDRLTNGQERLTDLGARLAEQPADVEDPQRARIRTLMQSIGDRLNEVMQRDAADQAALERARDATSEDRRNVDASRAARSAYQSGGGRGSRFADQRG